MTRTIIRLNSFIRAEEFDRIKKEWEQENPDTCLIPYTMKLERGRARWEYQNINPPEKIRGITENVPVWACSNCKHMYMQVDGFNYCPNCGAEMEGTK